METTINHNNLEFKFSDDDVVNPDDLFTGWSEKCFLLHDHGFPLAVCFADNLQEALDEAADADRLDCYKLTEEEVLQRDKNNEDMTVLGNSCLPYDIESMDVHELPMPKLSVCALFNKENKS